MALNKYKVFSYSDQNKKSYNLNFDCIINKDDDSDVNFVIKLNHEMYISEFDKKILLDSLIILSSKNDNSNKIQLNYNLIDDKNTEDDCIKDLVSTENVPVMENVSVIENVPVMENVSVIENVPVMENVYDIEENSKETVLDTNNDINIIINNLISHIDTFKNKFKIDNETLFDSLQDIKEIIEEEKKSKEKIGENFTPLEFFLLDAIKNKEILKNQHDPEKIKPLLKLNRKKIDIEDDENEYEIQEDDEIKNKEEKVEDNMVKINTYVKDVNKKYIELNKEKNEIQDTLLKLAEEENNKKDMNDKDLNEFITIENKIYNHLKIILSSKSINANNIIYIVTELMKFIEIFKIKGVDKKTIILATLRKFLTDEKYTDEQIDFIIDIICKELIDILISIDKRKITIRKNFSCFIPWCN